MIRRRLQNAITLRPKRIVIRKNLMTVNRNKRK